MRKFEGISQEKGNFVEWLLIFLAVTVVIFALVVPRYRSPLTLNTLVPQIGESTGGGTTYSGSAGASGGTTISSSVSASVSISTGNAPYSIQPGEEYIVLENRGGSPVDITGWRLENGKSAKVYAVGDNEVHYASDTAIIPQGAKVLSPYGSSFIGDIILKPGERAVVVTGSPGNISPYSVVSFKENSCTGYLKEYYKFPSGLEKSCIRPAEEPGASRFDQACEDFIDRISTCHTPKVNTWDAYGKTIDSRGNTCEGCIEGQSFTSVCSSFIKSHYSYPGCLANHQGDANFEGKVWHVYLYKRFEMWVSSHETISLYDSFGRLMAVTSY